MALICSGPRAKSITGKRAKRQASKPPSLWWIGSTSAPPVRRDRPAAVGHPPRIGEATRSSKSNSRYRTAVPAQAVSSVPTVRRPRRVGCSRCVPSSSIWPCKPHGNGKPRRNSKQRMRHALGLKARFHRAFERSDYVRPVTVVWRKFISSRTSRPPRSISAGCMPG